MSKARDELANKYRDSMNAMRYAPDHWRDDRENIINYVLELEQRIADLIGAVQDFARENSELEARCGELEQNLSTAQDMVKLLRADCVVRDEQNKELMESIKLITEVLCNSCPDVTKKQCIDFAGCYCLQQSNKLLRKHTEAIE